jgi:hypothetical protein
MPASTSILASNDTGQRRFPNPKALLSYTPPSDKRPGWFTAGNPTEQKGYAGKYKRLRQICPPDKSSAQLTYWAAVKHALKRTAEFREAFVLRISLKR